MNARASWTVWLMVAGVVLVIATGCSRPRTAALLIDAAMGGDVAECDRLVKGGLPVNATDEDGNTALHFAVFYCQFDVVRKLVELGADVNLANNTDYTLLMYAATTLRGRYLRGMPEQRNKIARFLIENGADVNHALRNLGVEGSGRTTLHFAEFDRNAGLVRTLLAAGANRNAKESPHGWTPLDMAKFPGRPANTEVISALEGAQTTAREEVGK